MTLDPYTARIVLICIFAALSAAAICAGGLFEAMRGKRR